MIDSHEDRINALKKLGLTYLQSKIYLSSLEAGPANVKTISQIADIAREDVYRVIPALLKTGLLKKHLASPAIYEALKPELAIAVLLKQKEEEYADARRKGKKLVQHFHKHQIISESSQGDEKTVWVVSSEKRPIDPLLMDTIRKTKRNLDFTTRYDLFAFSMNNPFLKKWIGELYKAVQRGVEIRMVLEKPNAGKLVNELSFSIKTSNSLVQNPGFKYRYLNNSPECIVIVFDNNKSLIEVSPKHDVAVSPYIWTDNPVLVNLAKTYFKTIWDSATEPFRIR